jgi:hypothetical protein
MGSGVERTHEGDFRVRLSRDERELLRRLPAELRALLGSDPGDASLRRLFPPAYDDDAAADDEYRRLMGGELLEHRREALRLFEETVGRERLRADELEAWLGAVNDLRLVLGTRLGVTEDVYERELDPSDPQAHGLAVFLYLTWLQEQLVEAAAG